MIYVLLDTNILKGNLISKTGFSKALLQLEIWCRNESITLLNPITLKEEWEKHAQKELDAIKKSTAQHKDVFETYETELSDSQIEVGQKKLSEQVSKLNELFSNYSSEIDIDTDLYQLGYQKQQNNNPPFNNKADSFNDWLIYSSTVRYILKSETSEFYFVTQNTNEFSDRNNKLLLHPELVEFARGTKVQYHITLKSFIEALYSLGYTKLESPHDSSEDTSKSKIKKSVAFTSEKHAIDEMEKLLKNATKDLDFLHYHHLNDFIFASFKYHTRFNNYVLDTEDKYLSNILKSTTLKKGKLIFLKDLPFTPSKEDLPKMNFILKQLRTNGIYYSEYDYNRANMPEGEKVVCYCIRCQLEAFKLLEINPRWKNSNETEFEFHLKSGFSWLKLGNFPKAYSELIGALNIAKNESNEMLIFRANYNLSKLHIRLRNNLLIGEPYDTILEELNKIVFDPISSNYKIKLNQSIVQWMSNENYIKEAFYEISQLKNKILDAQRSSYNNGRSRNNFINQLAFKYSQIHLYLQNNLFYFEDFTEWRDIAESFIEAVLVSYSTKEGSGRLESANDWILIQFLKFGNASKINRQVQQLKLRNIKYTQNNNAEYQITTLINNLLDTDYKRFVSEHFEDNYSKQTFYDKQKEWIHNAMVILGLVDFETSYIQSTITKIINRIKRDGLDFDIFQLHSLLIRRADILTNKQLKEIVIIGLTSPTINPFFFFANIAEIAMEKQTKVLLSREESKFIDEMIRGLHTNDICALVHLARILKGKQHKRVIEEIVGLLKNEDHYSEAPLYLSAVLNDLIDYDEGQIKAYIHHFTPMDEPLKIGRPFMYSEKYNYQLNQLIDIFYKYDTPISLYNKLMKHSEYYQWLLQPDEFDYDKFHAEWITLHDGLNYNMRFRQSKSLKNSLETYLKQNYSLIADQVRERYNKIYCD